MSIFFFKSLSLLYLKIMGFRAPKEDIPIVIIQMTCCKVLRWKEKSSPIPTSSQIQTNISYVLQYYLLVICFCDFIEACCKWNDSNNHEPTNSRKNVYKGFTFVEGNLIVILCNRQKADSYKKMDKFWGFCHGTVIQIWINFADSRSLHPPKSSRQMFIYIPDTR